MPNHNKTATEMAIENYEKDRWQSHGVVELRERYLRDAQFKAMVDQLTAFMIQNKVQPYEVRDAAFIAELRYRERVVMPLMMKRF